jgi:serpin B
MEKNQKGSAILAILIVLILAIAAAIGAGWYAYRFYSAVPENIDMPEINFSAGPELLDENPPDGNEAKEEVEITPETEEPVASPEPFVEYETGQDSSPIVSATNQFAFELYNQYKNTNDNVFFSPHSISSALQMTYEGARGKTAEEMQSVFHFPEDNAARIGSFAKLYEQINPQNASYRLSTANALWAQNDYPFDQNYLKTVETYYHGKAANLDFAGNPENSRQTINQWVSGKTMQKIPELFAAGTINPLTRLVLTNAVYFKGKWAIPFEEMLTQEKDFTPSTGAKTKCQTMNIKDNFGYAQTADYQALELPYEGNGLSMMVILPQTGKMATVENNLSMEKFAAIKNDLKSELANVFLPKFKFDTSYNMNQTLAKMGMSTAFDDANADFSGMYDKTKTPENLYIGLVIHKAYIDVYEEGTEAAAATGVTMQATAVMEPPQAKIFNADRPFIFAIVHNQTGAILFMGKVNDPTK